MLIGPWDERPINVRLQQLRREAIADRLAARGWDRNTHKFETVVTMKVRKVRHLSHCRYDSDIDPVKLKKAHDDYRQLMERQGRIRMRNIARNNRHG